jgi:hypothetical protein
MKDMQSFMYDLLRKEERRKLKRKLKLEAREKARAKRATGKARICKNCGLWIQKRRILYTEPNGVVRDYGLMYIHINVRKKDWDTIERCYPEPRPIPTREVEP